MLCALIMAGGSGQRFWPLSTEEQPKQLLRLFSDKTMILETVERILPLVPKERVFIATNVKQVDRIQKELPMIHSNNIIIEPMFRDTAAAIGYGTLYIQHRHPDTEIIVLASDHLIRDAENFRSVLSCAAEEAHQQGTIVTLGIQANKPETGYGYIETIANPEIGTVHFVTQFWEKPSLERAKSFLEAGNFLWNSGMYVYRIQTMLMELNRFLPRHMQILKKIKTFIDAGWVQYQLSEAVKPYFEAFEKISIDYAVMEKSQNIRVIPCDFGWHDVGSFNAIEDIFESNEYGSFVKNTIHRSIHSNGNIIISEDDTVVTIGVKDLVIIKKGQNILICHKERLQEIKEII